MRLLLQQRPQGHEAPRFVQLQLQSDLFGQWELVRETGQQGARSTLRRDQFNDHASALQALEKARDQHLKKGFQLMFAQGVDAPR
ncbi:WGR domain-containing protein [Lysobacter soyae]|uniref:WGR domain-containing protein n=1 Tax=Lysobacter soyae TaxID=2764185 RepID=A0ABX8WRJ9_9GAMM|nr:WGR domain-containing protein [Lysobacter sp. CJ11]QYR53455.1 WGR domain-containing protein [Lysobacter sp. CJ11]